MAQHLHIIFVSLAKNQSRFFASVGQVISKSGISVSHVCFHEGGARELALAGHQVFNPYEYQPSVLSPIRDGECGVLSSSVLLGHEKAAYEIYDTDKLSKKFNGHLQAMRSIVNLAATTGDRVVMVQELGGFTSVLASYYAARDRGIFNFFIEPSFFKGRVFFSQNTFLAPVISQYKNAPNKFVQEILKNIVQARQIVIPSKDELHYRPPIKKLLDLKNYRRLCEKLVAKYVRREREEFTHIAGHVARNARMYFNARKLQGCYQNIPAGKKFIYYPLHVPADFSLTIRSPEYLDQYALIDYICRVAPQGYLVVIKEHPALVGAISPSRIRSLSKRHDNFVLLNPSINNHDVLAAADRIVTVNSKSGAEALLHLKPIAVLGDAFYRDCELVTSIQSLKELPQFLSQPRIDVPREKVERFFQDVWDSSVPGELYEMSDANVEVFARSLQTHLMLMTKGSSTAVRS